MKVALCLLVLLPLAFSAPVEPDVRSFFGNLLKPIAQDLINAIGSDDSEQECERRCPALLHTFHIPASLQQIIDMGAMVICPAACHEVQKLLQSVPVGK